MLASFRFHHFGLATRNMAQSAAFLTAGGYRIGEWVFDPEQSVTLAFAEHPSMPSVELIAAKDGVPSPVDNLLKSAAAAVYHLGYGCVSLETAVEELKTGGFRAMRVSPPKPAILFGGARVAFYFIREFGLVELIEEEAGQG